MSILRETVPVSKLNFRFVSVFKIMSDSSKSWFKSKLPGLKRNVRLPKILPVSKFCSQFKSVVKNVGKLHLRGTLGTCSNREFFEVFVRKRKKNKINKFIYCRKYVLYKNRSSVMCTVALWRRVITRSMNRKDETEIMTHCFWSKIRSHDGARLGFGLSGRCWRYWSRFRTSYLEKIHYFQSFEIGKKKSKNDFLDFQHFWFWKFLQNHQCFTLNYYFSGLFNIWWIRAFWSMSNLAKFKSREEFFGSGFAIFVYLV